MPDEPDLITRRRFLGTSILGAALTWTIPVFLDRTFLALHAEAASSGLQTLTGRDHPILVVVQLAGGNDGLNTIVPFGGDAYYRARPTIGIPKQQVLSVDGLVGFNPALAPLKSLYDSGHLAVIQGVGYPNPNRSHFVSTEIWQTASDAKGMVPQGWLGRYFDNCCKGADPTVGLTIGGQLPQAFNAENPTGVTLNRPNHLGFDREPDAFDQEVFEATNGLEHTNMTGDSIGNLSGASSSVLSPLEYLQRTALDVQVSSDQISAVLKRSKREASYPPTQLGRSLSLIGRLIAGGLPTRVYYASQGGYDTHQGQIGTHHRLLDELAKAVAALCSDLKAKGIFDRVLVMTFSEFGRRVAENASKGTDHGTAAPMFVAGGSIRPGLYGKQPELDLLDGGDLVYNTDFRSVYATVLANWMKAPAARILGHDFPKLAFV
jgi:uncharacterized protein (DUF1501 family)